MAPPKKSPYGKTTTPHTHPGGVLCSPAWCGSSYKKNPSLSRRIDDVNRGRKVKR